MNKVAVAVAVVVLLAVGLAGQAATLQAGWYARIGTVSMEGTDPVTHSPASVGWVFSGGLGTYGPFTVTDAHDPAWVRRTVAVTDITTGVQAGTGVLLQGTAATTPWFPVTDITFAYGTFYDASQMRLDVLLIHQNGGIETIYSETRSVPISTVGGAYMGSAGYLQPGDTIAFRVATVPEPGSGLVLLSLLAPVAAWIRRRPR